jgi:WhiB family redox-sensing transcriptional regulator
VRLVDFSSAAWERRPHCGDTDAEETQLVVATTAPSRVCPDCDVRTECLEYALTHDQRFGVRRVR